MCIRDRRTISRTARSSSRRWRCRKTARAGTRSSSRRTRRNSARNHRGLRIVIGREGALQREIELFPDDELLWKTPPGIANSAGNLALHVCGNLQYFVGAVLGETGYVRDRPLEFSRRSGTRAELVRELRK